MSRVIARRKHQMAALSFEPCSSMSTLDSLKCLTAHRSTNTKELHNPGFKELQPEREQAIIIIHQIIVQYRIRPTYLSNAILSTLYFWSCHVFWEKK